MGNFTAKVQEVDSCLDKIVNCKLVLISQLFLKINLGNAMKGY